MAIPSGVGTGPQNDPTGYWSNNRDAQGRYPGDPYYGMPAFPTYTPGYDGAKMSVQDIQPDPRALQAFRQQALRTGPSAWADLAASKSYAEQAAAKDALARQAAGNLATAQSGLAMRGGLRSGAAERLQTAAGRDLLNESQKLGQQGSLNRMQIGINDEQNRISQLGMLPDMELSDARFRLGTRQYDLNNSIEEVNRQNKFKLKEYDNESGIWAAGKQADATANSSGGGISWICTEARKRACRRHPKFEDYNEIPLRKFKWYAIRNHYLIARFYLYHCDELVRRMVKAKDVDWKEIYKFVQLVIYHADHGALDKAFAEYYIFVRDLMDKYWPDCTHPIYLKNKGKVTT